MRAIPVLKEKRKSLTPVIAAPPPHPHPSTPDPFSSTSDWAHWGNDLPGACHTARPARGHFIYLPPFLSLSNGLAARSFACPFRQKNRNHLLPLRHHRHHSPLLLGVSSVFRNDFTETLARALRNYSTCSWLVTGGPRRHQ